MKNIYTLCLSFVATVALAQQTTSFETSEGYQLGSIHGQNNWEVTEGSDGLITNQVITNEIASNGTFSFKNAFEPAFSDQWFPIFGASRTFAEPADYTDFTISYDVLITEKNGSDFEFTLFTINENEEFVPVAGVGIENRGFIYLIKDVDYQFEYAEAEWTPNQWINVKIEVTAENIRYYINNTLQSTIPNFTGLDIVGLNMLHNNFGADGYYDNFVITTGNLGSGTFEASLLSIYPNPANDHVSIIVPGNIEVSKVSIYDITGQVVLETAKTNDINISQLAKGTYILKAAATDGSFMTEKIVKL